MKRRSHPSTNAQSAHYLDAEYYDQAYRRRRHDIEYYVNVALQYGGPVLELGAGSARVAAAIASAGVDIVAMEPIAQMRARAEGRKKRLNARHRAHLQVIDGDMTSFQMPERFALITAPFNVLMHAYCHSDLEKILCCVGKHLRPEGRFVFDVMLPDPNTLRRDPSKGYRAGRVPHPSTGDKYIYREYFHYDAMTQIQTVLMDFEHPQDAKKSFVIPLSQRQWFPQEVRYALHRQGFEICSHSADFDGSELDAQAESQVIVARLATRAAGRRNST